MKNKVIEIARLYGTQTEYSGNNRIMYLRGGDVDAAFNHIIRQFHYRLPFEIMHPRQTVIVH